MTKYIDAFRSQFGVEPICRTLAVAPSSNYAGRSRPPSARALADAELKLDIARVHRDQFGVYGARKLWRALRREGLKVGRDRVARLMGALGLVGATRTRRTRTTVPAPVAQRPADLAAPNRLWLADLTAALPTSWPRRSAGSATPERADN